MKARILASISFFFLLLSLYSSAGFDITLTASVPIYVSAENIPFSEKKLLDQLNPDDRVQSLGCFDNKSDVFFQVSMPDGRIGYLYNFNFVAKKRVVPSAIDIKYFLSDITASFQCLIMVPEYSK